MIKGTWNAYSKRYSTSEWENRFNETWEKTELSEEDGSLSENDVTHLGVCPGWSLWDCPKRLDAYCVKHFSWGFEGNLLLVTDHYIFCRLRSTKFRSLKHEFYCAIWILWFPMINMDLRVYKWMLIYKVSLLVNIYPCFLSHWVMKKSDEIQKVFLS